MTEKELKRLSRAELLEMLIATAKKLERVERELDSAKKELARRDVAVTDAGSLAEAALRLNRVFEDADAAAKQYIDILRMRAESVDNADGKADDADSGKSADSDGAK